MTEENELTKPTGFKVLFIRIIFLNLLFGEQFKRNVTHRGMQSGLFREFLCSFRALT